jgi:hypothetical protein
MTFSDFYAKEYLAGHADRTCRRLHGLGLLASLAFLGLVVWLRIWWLLILLPAPAYLLAWLGHLLARNWPTASRHPIWSFLAY